MSKTIFRAYDVRGVYGTEINEEVAKRIGCAFGSYINKGIICLGRDTRMSGPSLQSSFLEGVLSTGCSVDSYGIVPISILSYITWKESKNAAAYISASHNPPQYNGVRFRTGDGYGLLYRETNLIKFYQDGYFISGDGLVTQQAPQAAIEAYSEHVEEKLRLKSGLKIVLDAGNGSACIIGPLYERLGFAPIMVNGIMDGTFPGRGPSPTQDSLVGACQAVIDQRADYGVGFDPDADRGIVIDEKGRVMPPEKVAIILARRRYSPGDLVIAGFDCSMILEQELLPDGIKVQRERVGDVFVANRVKNSGAVLGVERSGHFFLPEFQYSDDPFAMSLALGEIVSEGQKLSQLADQIPDLPYLQKSIRVENVDATALMATLEEMLSSLEPDTTDGLKIAKESYSILIRPSNTEPLIRLYIETTGRDLEDLAGKYENIIRDALKRQKIS
jgi:phosphomannomutase/phosphoglucomutase